MDRTPNITVKTAIWGSGKTQTDIAERIGVSESRLSRFLHGRAELTDDEKKRLARALRIPADALFPPDEAVA
jgi:transcriptional regulator with XRE-family HTH domain